MIQAVLFDMDGTLVDSEPLWHESDKAFLATKNIFLTPEEWVHIVGKGGSTFIRELQAEKGLEGDFDTLMDEKNSAFEKIARVRSVAFPEMMAFNMILRSKGIQTAIASASSPVIIDATINCIDARDKFDGFFSGDEVARSKPDPMLFLHAADKLGVEPEHCLVIEDSQYGVEAGHRAGMSVAAVPHAIHPATRTSFELADYLFEEGLREFNAASFYSRLQQDGLL